MYTSKTSLPKNKKIYFASDFHLGAPDAEESLIRERKIIRWLDSIQKDAHAVFLVGDVFDFWYEYKRAIPKGFVRFQGKLAELTDKGIEVVLFTGNHDMWMNDYFSKELNVAVYHEPLALEVNDKLLLIGHGDGLGAGDKLYKLLKKLIFQNKVCRWAFDRLHPDIGVGIAHAWSGHSRIKKANFGPEEFKGADREWLYQYAVELEQKEHHDYYIFGHRHLPMDLEVNPKSRYINLGEWINYFSYASFDGSNLELSYFTEKIKKQVLNL